MDRARVSNRRFSVFLGVPFGVAMYAMGWGMTRGLPRHVGFSVVNLAVTCVGAVLLMYLFGSYSKKTPELKFILGNLLALGLVGLLLGTPMAGWLGGLEAFGILVGGAVALPAFLAVCGGTLFGIGWLAYQAWKRLRTTWFGRPFVRLGEYLNATNVPEAMPPADN